MTTGCRCRRRRGWNDSVVLRGCVCAELGCVYEVVSSFSSYYEVVSAPHSSHPPLLDHLATVAGRGSPLALFFRRLIVLSCHNIMVVVEFVLCAVVEHDRDYSANRRDADDDELTM